MATRDVQLIIKARDEASRVFSTISGSVATLIGSQDKLVSSSSGVASGMASVLAQAKTFDSAFAKISGAADRAEASFTRQQQALAESRSAYAATATELLNLASAQERLQSTIVDQRLAGEDTSKSVAQLQAVVAALDKQAATRARLKTSIVAQESALATEASAMQQLGSIAIATEQALAALTDEQNRQVRAATAVADAQENAAAASARAAEMQARIAASTGTGRVGRSAADSASVFAADFDNAAAAAERLRQRTDPLYAIQAKLNNELAEAQVLYRKGALSADQLADAERRLKIEAEQAATALDRQGRGEMGKPSLFGLKPYELTNLGYQVNDVFTQLASGTSITQTLAQQGGQILQLLPGIGAGLVKAFTNPLVLAGIAAIAGISVVFVKAANDAERLRGVEGILAGIAGESKQSAQDLAGIAERLEDIGLSAEESLAAVRGFLTQGLNTEYLTAFASMAKQVAVVTGEDLPDAMEKLQDAFSGGYDAIAELDDQLQFLTVSEREQIRALFDAGKASEAREIAVRKLSEQLRDQARASGDAKGALASLTEGLDNFFDALAETRNPLVALRDAALQFGADFLSQIAQMLLQMAALQVASKIGFGKGASGLNSLLNVAPLAVASTQLSAAGTQVQAAGVSMVTSAVLWQATAASISAAAALLLAANAAGGAGIFHGGGIAGSANRSRRVSPVWFAAATRYHTGGIAGLRPNEVPAILERGEEIITKNDARHRNNGGGADGGSLSERVNVTVQNLLDSGDIIEQGLSTRKGEQKMLNLITKNRGAIRAALDN